MAESRVPPQCGRVMKEQTIYQSAHTEHFVITCKNEQMMQMIIRTFALLV